MNNYIVLDLETTNHTTYGRLANPLEDSNYIVAAGLKIGNLPPIAIYNNILSTRERMIEIISYYLEDKDLIIGHNLKFDLLYLWGCEVFQKWLRNGGKVWDTSLAEYFLTGQVSQYSKLRTLAAGKYKQPERTKHIERYFDNNVTTDRIPKDLVCFDVLEDVIDTEAIYLAQYKAAELKKMVPFIETHMRHLLATIEMEFNGLHVDENIAFNKMQDLTEEVFPLKISILEIAEKYWPKSELEFKIDSSNHISCLLFGGTIKGVKIEGFGLKPSENWKAEKAGFYSTSEEVLVKCAVNKKSSDFCNKLLKYRELTKLLTTYFIDEERNKGMLTRRYEKDSCIHHELIPFGTNTARLNSKNPNQQNLPASVLDMFTSRFGDEGVIMEADYSQLEVLIQAKLTNSKQMLLDIQNGVDFHCKRLAYAKDVSYDACYHKVHIEKDPVWIYERKTIAKPISFQKAYGAYPPTIAENAGIPLEIVERVFQKEDEEYPEINKFYDGVVLPQVLQSQRPTHKALQIKNKSLNVIQESESEKINRGVYQSIFGQLFSFDESAVTTKRGVFRYYKLTQIRNRPVQGTAALIVSLAVGELLNWSLANKDKCRLVNEIHDAVLLDVKKEHLELTKSVVKHTLESVSSLIKSRFNLEFDVPFIVDVKTGKSWADCK
jgi:DNA polymerase I-like protein with 3'-5' exonuclease and polymerase domains